MTWSAPSPKKPREISTFLRELDEDQVEPGSDVELAAIRVFLNAQAEKTCRCGRTLARWEKFSGGICFACQERLADERSRSVTPLEERLEKLGVPARYRTYTMANWRGGLDNALVVWARRPHGVCLLTGQTGTGKTHLGVILLAMAQAENVWAQYASSRHSLRELMSENRAGSERSEWRRLTRPRLLMLDDLGAEPGTEWSLDLIGAVLDQRHQDLRATLITSNLTMDQIHAVDHRIGSRLAEDCITFTVTGRDRRMAA